MAGHPPGQADISNSMIGRAALSDAGEPFSIWATLHKGLRSTAVNIATGIVPNLLFYFKEAVDSSPQHHLRPR